MTARGIRNNNPGNIDFNAKAFERDPWVGELGIEEHRHARFTTFDTPEHGIRALCKILLTYQRKYGLGTIPEIIDRWAPPSENDTTAYVDHICELLDVTRETVLSLSDIPDKLAELAKAIIQHENGEQPYSDEIVQAGVDMALA